ncbi:VOC family protein [Nocardiopsis listeri]|uniref:VOC family protein n=1 Tax=Nocardiopsis listeri TaxID=53440 RepID=UPI000A77F8B2|nr:VOC family protein [Nocardiopsis listeri]
MGIPEEELPGDAGETPESIVDPAGRGPRVWFQQVPEPKVVKNRVHPDLKVGGGRRVPLSERVRRVTAVVERSTAAGGTVLRVLDHPETEYYAVVLQDPEGNEFCVV